MFDERSPIYRQIADQIKGDILSGALAAAEQVMSTNQYASFYRINPATAAKAFQQLVDEGILYKKRGIGMFVAENARATLLRLDRDCFFTELVDPMVAKARAVEIPLEEVIAYIRQVAKEDAR